MNQFNPPHPGEVLAEYMQHHPVEYWASKTGISVMALGQILRAERSISPDESRLLSIALNTSADMWNRMQANYDTSSFRR